MPYTLALYKNGNTSVELFSDGTKVRTVHSTTLALEFPESVDLKITDYCDGRCKWCHESSTTRGKHAPYTTLTRMVRGLPPGVEIAIGGGDPLSHPDCVKFLKHCKELGLIANITVNGQHVRRYQRLLNDLRWNFLIRGLGVSHHPALGYGDFKSIKDPNTVLHFICGVDKVTDVVSFCDDTTKVLILGYKHYGRGVNVTPKSVDEWKFWLPHIIATSKVVAFDNLALEQLDVKNILTETEWNKLYMGDDGTFTMYADAVRDGYGVNSTSGIQPAQGRTIVEWFTQHANAKGKKCS